MQTQACTVGLQFYNQFDMRHILSVKSQANTESILYGNGNTTELLIELDRPKSGRKNEVVLYYTWDIQHGVILVCRKY